MAYLTACMYEYYKREISICVELNKSLKIRQRFLRQRRFSVLFFFLFNLLCLLSMCWISNIILNDNSSLIVKVITGRFYQMTPGTIFTNAVFLTIMGYTLGGGFNSYKEYNPISVHTIKDLFKIQDKSFILFLRGFDRDNYGAKYTEKVNESFFSEKIFAEHMPMPLYAVGMTKELTSPIGATRVYLNDESWKEDVLFLMKKAYAIFILVNKKPSCIWEIEQSEKMLEKTCFLIDNMEQYCSVRDRLKGIIEFPDYFTLDATLPLSIRFVDSPCQENGKELHKSRRPYILNFTNSEVGYSKFINKLFHTKKIKTLQNINSSKYVLFISNFEQSLAKAKRNQQLEQRIIREVRHYFPIKTTTNISKEGNVIEPGVIKQIKEATYIVILIGENVNNSILQLCMKMKEKTIFIVSDSYYYTYIRLKYKELETLPYIDNESFTFFAFYYENESLCVEKKLEEDVDRKILNICINKFATKHLPWYDILTDKSIRFH